MIQNISIHMFWPKNLLKRGHLKYLLSVERVTVQNLIKFLKTVPSTKITAHKIRIQWGAGAFKGKWLPSKQVC